MAILIEGISVVIRRDTIARLYEGGWRGFVADRVNSTLCADSEVTRKGFMHPDDVRTFIQRLERHAFVFRDATGAAVDIVVVDQCNGPTTPCAWIEFFRQRIPGGTVSAARLKGSLEKNLYCPDGWDFEHSLSYNFRFHPGTKLDEKFEFMKKEAGIEVFRDRWTGQEIYVGHPDRALRHGRKV